MTIASWIDNNFKKCFALAYFIPTGLALAGVIYFQTYLNNFSGSQLCAYVENVDGKKGFSKEDILDFAKYAQLDSIQTSKALEEIPVDTLRDFGKYFNSFAWSEYKKPNDGEIAVTSGSLALNHYSGVDKMQIMLKKRADSLEAVKEYEKHLEANIQEHLGKIIVFPGSMDEYSRRVGYPVISIHLPRNDQSISLSIDYNQDARTLVDEPDSIRKCLYDNNIEAIVNENQSSRSSIYLDVRRGLPVARNPLWK